MVSFPSHICRQDLIKINSATETILLQAIDSYNIYYSKHTDCCTYTVIYGMSDLCEAYNLKLYSQLALAYVISCIEGQLLSTVIDSLSNARQLGYIHHTWVFYFNNLFLMHSVYSLIQNPKETSRTSQSTKVPNNIYRSYPVQVRSQNTVQPNTSRVRA